MQSFIDKLLPGDLILTSSRRFNVFSFAIRFASFCKHGYAKRIWTHVAVYAGGGEVIEALSSGIEKRDLKSAYPEKEFRLMALRRKPSPAGGLPEVPAYCAQFINQKYDWRALAYFVLSLVTPRFLTFLIDNKFVDGLLNTGDAYFCSELAGDGLLKTGHYAFGEPPHRLMPVDFYNPFGFRKVAVWNRPRPEPLWKKVLITAGYLIGIVVVNIILVTSLALFVLLISYLRFLPLWVMEKVKGEEEK